MSLDDGQEGEKERMSEVNERTEQKAQTSWNRMKKEEERERSKCESEWEKKIIRQIRRT